MTPEEAAEVTEDHLEMVADVADTVADVTSNPKKAIHKKISQHAKKLKDQMTKVPLKPEHFKEMTDFIDKSKSELRRGVYKYMVPDNLKIKSKSSIAA